MYGRGRGGAYAAVFLYSSTLGIFMAVAARAPDLRRSQAAKTDSRVCL